MRIAFGTRQLLESVLIGFLGVLASLIATLPMLPVVMQDEYVYRRQVLLLSPTEYDYPNYLFSGLAALAEASTFDFYTAIKLQNALSVGLAVGVIYWALCQLANKSIAFMASVLFLAVPSFFQSSFYMPDMFLSAFLASSLALLVLAVGKSLDWKNPIWVFSALLLGFALLSKPHALFFVCGIIVYGFVTFIRSRSISPTFLVAGLAVILRLGVGFAVAGNAGLNLLGSSYSQSLVGAPDQVEQQNLVASGLSGSGGVGNLLATFGWEFGQLFGALSLMSMGLLVLILIRSLRSNENLLVSIVLLTGIAAIAAFETFVSATGDDHSGRILTRHLEYMLAIIVALGLVELQKYHSITKKNVVPVMGLVAVSVVVGTLLLSAMPLHRVSDGASVVLSGLWGGGYLIAATLLVVALWLTQMSSSKWPAIAAVAMFVLLNFSAHAEIRGAYATKTQVDEFAQLVAADLDLRGREVFVLANSKASAELFLFYTVPQNSKVNLLEPGSSFDVTSNEKPEAIFFPLENIGLVASCPAKQIGQFNYFDCRP